MRATFRCRALALAALLPALGTAAPAAAADWVMAQAMEPPSSTHRFFALIQASYVNAYGCDRMQGLRNVGPNAFSLNNGLYNVLCRVGPEFRDERSAFNLDNLAVGARGNIVPGRLNYFLMANAGMNLANYRPLDTSRARTASVTDATITASYIPHVRVRAGLMRKPGPEELYQAIDANYYIFPTDFIARVQVEKFVRTNTKGTTPIPGQSDGTSSFHAYDADVGRDWGIQFFDAIRAGKWSHTWAVMVGNGSGIHDPGDNDGNGAKDTNLYYAAEYDLPGGTGPHKHGVKLYAYRQAGTRSFEVDASGTQGGDFGFTRQGIGLRARGELFGEGRGTHRIGIDYMHADGMIFYTPTANVVDAPFGGQIQIGAEKGNKARGTTLEYGFHGGDKWQVGARLSRHDVLYSTLGTATWNAADKRVIKQLTFTASYQFSPATRLTVNWEPRDAKAPNAAANPIAAANANIVVDAVGARLGVQFTHQF